MSCYLCKLRIPHNEREHAEVLEGGLKAIHKGHYPGMTNGFTSDRFPEEAGVRIAYGDMSYDELVQAYMKKGKTRRIAVQYAKNRMKIRALKIDQPKVDGSMDIKQFEDLTLRGKQILRLVAEGLQNKEIGQRLDISEKTVKAHVTSVMQRIGVKTRTQAAIAFLTFQQGKADGSKDAGESSQASEARNVPTERVTDISEGIGKIAGGVGERILPPV